MLRKITATALLVPLAFASAASAEPLIEGCWGAGSASYCDPSVRITPIRGDSSPTPVCAGTCTYVGVPTVQPVQDRYEVCIDYTTPAGYPASDCYVDLDSAALMDLLREVVADARDCEVDIKDGILACFLS